jgi:hypothetical protein
MKKIFLLLLLAMYSISCQPPAAEVNQKDEPQVSNSGEKVETNPVLMKIPVLEAPVIIDETEHSAAKLNKRGAVLSEKEILSLIPEFPFTTNGDAKTVYPSFFQIKLSDGNRLIGAVQKSHKAAGSGDGMYMGTVISSLLFVQVIKEDGSLVGEFLTPVIYEDKIQETYMSADVKISKEEISIITKYYNQEGAPAEGPEEHSDVKITANGVDWK